MKQGKYEPLINAGAMLSNIAFNLKQKSWVPEDVRETLEECQKLWDAELTKIRTEQKRKKAA